jgi:hypothetical protein
MEVPMQRRHSFRWLVLLSTITLGCVAAPPTDEAAPEPSVEADPDPEPEPESEPEPNTPAPVVEARKPTRAPAPAPAPEREREIVALEVPEGTILELELLTALDSSVHRVGDEIQARTLSPLYVSGEEALPAGTHVEGHITEVEASGRVKGRARLGFTFERLRTPSGLEKIRTSFVEQEAESGKKKDAAIIGGAAGVGAIVGGIIGGKKGAAIGASIGGAGGTGVVLTTKGEEIRLPVGTTVNVRLDEPVVIQRDSRPTS